MKFSQEILNACKGVVDRSPSDVLAAMRSPDIVGEGLRKLPTIVEKACQTGGFWKTDRGKAVLSILRSRPAMACDRLNGVD